jgi:hypothetical protein
MIGVIFQFGNQIVEVRVNDLNCLFRVSSQYGGAFVTIDQLRLEKNGVVKEFPDLKENTEWKKIAIERFKEKLKNYKTEEERINYVIEDLKKFGYVPLYKQKNGHRPEKIE